MLSFFFAGLRELVHYNCIQLRMSLRKSYFWFQLLFSGEDYDNESIPVFIDIAPFTMEGCFEVDIVDDGINEPLQSFQLTAQIEGSAAPTATTIVNINDDDGRIDVYVCIHVCVYVSVIKCRPVSASVL